MYTVTGTMDHGFDFYKKISENRDFSKTSYISFSPGYFSLARKIMEFGRILNVFSLSYFADKMEVQRRGEALRGTNRVFHLLI